MVSFAPFVDDFYIEKYNLLFLSQLYDFALVGGVAYQIWRTTYDLP